VKKILQKSRHLNVFPRIFFQTEKSLEPSQVQTLQAEIEQLKVGETKQKPGVFTETKKRRIGKVFFSLPDAVGSFC